MSVSLDLMGFYSSKRIGSLQFFINYILWFHTWQDIQYNKKFNGAVGILSKLRMSEVTCMGCTVYPSWITNEGKMSSCDYGEFLKPI